jgi:hypothetical protein
MAQTTPLKSAVAKYASTELLMTVSDRENSRGKCVPFFSYLLHLYYHRVASSWRKNGFFKSALATAYFSVDAARTVYHPFFTNRPRNSAATELNQLIMMIPQSCSANSSHSSCPRCINVTLLNLKLITNQSASESWINQTLLSFYPCTSYRRKPFN